MDIWRQRGIWGQHTTSLRSGCPYMAEIKGPSIIVATYWICMGLLTSGRRHPGQVPSVVSCGVGQTQTSFFRMQKQRIKSSRATRLLKVASEIASFCLEIVTWELHQIIRWGGAVCTDAPALERRGRIVWRLREACCMPRTCCRTIPPRCAPPSPLERIVRPHHLCSAAAYSPVRSAPGIIKREPAWPRSANPQQKQMFLTFLSFSPSIDL
jgi:hypothetical protein